MGRRMLGEAPNRHFDLGQDLSIWAAPRRRFPPLTAPEGVRDS